MAKKGEKLWFLQLDFDWMHDAKIVRLKAKYGKAVLVDAVNTFILMAKCDGVADMKDPAHVDWAESCLGKSGKALRDTFDKLAEFEVISSLFWREYEHVTSNRACADAESRKRQKESDEKRTRAARKALEEKRKGGGERPVAGAVTDSVTDAVTDP